MPRFARKLKRHEGTARIEAFSDGVFAIAATLLAVDLKPPRGATSGAQLAHALAEQWPMYVSYAMSFLYIGIIWAHHHAVFKLVKRSDQVFLTLNILFLMVIAVLPFPTAVLGEYLGERGDRHRIATLLYTGTLFLAGALFNALWLWGKHEARLIDDELDAELIRATTRHYLVAPLAYALAFVVAWWSPVIAVLIVFVMAFFYLLPSELLQSYEVRSKPTVVVDLAPVEPTLVPEPSHL
jgi:uncharacterized membrane protein